MCADLQREYMVRRDGFAAMIPSRLLPGWLWDWLRERDYVKNGPHGRVRLEVSVLA
jgi:hypothetical protein